MGDVKSRQNQYGFYNFMAVKKNLFVETRESGAV
jgi:hypothetical protein